MNKEMDRRMWDSHKQEYVNVPEDVYKFLNEIKELCIKYNISISHEDCQGSFILTFYNKQNMEWLFDANLERIGNNE